MEISNKIPPVASKGALKPVEKTPDKATTPVAKGDRVDLSARAQELKAAQEAIKQMDDVDDEKVAKIKAQIKAGTYEVDAEKAAGNILAESLIGDTE